MHLSSQAAPGPGLGWIRMKVTPKLRHQLNADLKMSSSVVLRAAVGGGGFSFTHFCPPSEAAMSWDTALVPVPVPDRQRCREP